MVYLQTDASINPGKQRGSTGGCHGGYRGTRHLRLGAALEGSDGLGFAIPVRIVDFVYQSLKKYGYVALDIEIGVPLPGTVTLPWMAGGLGLGAGLGRRDRRRLVAAGPRIRRA